MADQQCDSPMRPIRGWPLEIPSWLFPGAVVSGPGGKRRFWIDSLLCNRLAGEISVKVRAYHSCSGCCMDIDPYEVSRDGMVVELSGFLGVFEAVAGCPYNLSPYMAKEPSTIEESSVGEHPSWDPRRLTIEGPETGG